MRWLVAMFALAGCGAKSAPPAKVKPEAPAPTCIKPPEDAATIRQATGDDSRVQYCIGTSACFAVELSTGKLTGLDEPPTAQPAALDPVPQVETTSPDLRVCSTAASCKSLGPQVWPGTSPLHAATNGNVAVVLLGDAEKGNGYADVWDVASAKKVATFKYARGDFRCGDVAMLGETIYLGANACANPSGRGALYSIKGKKVANVGGNEFGTFGNVFVQTGGPTWAFLEENGNKVAIQNVATGKVEKTIDVSALWRTDGSTAKEAIGNPGESALVRLAAGKLAVIGGTPANGSIAIIEVESGDVKVVRVPLCH